MRKERPEFADIYPAGEKTCERCGSENLAGEYFHYSLLEGNICPDCNEKVEKHYKESKKKAYISGEEEPAFTDEITCPWCGEEYYNSWEMRNDGEEECEECGKPFSYERHIEVTYCTSRVNIKESVNNEYTN